MRALLTAVGTMMIFGAVTFVLWQGAHRVLADEMTGGELSQFLIYAVYVAISAASLSEMWGEVQRAAGAMERLVELKNAQPVIVAPPQPQNVSRRRRRVASASRMSRSAIRRGPTRWRSIAFARYRAGRERRVRRSVGRRQEHDVPAAAALLRSAVRPRSSSTVSTSRRRGPRTLRRRIGLVPQETVLFGTSARENIRYGRPGASDAEIEAAARAAGADSFIRAAARRLRHIPRRARHAPVGRPASAHRHRARAAEGSADPAARRSDQLARRRERTLRAGGAGAADGEPHDHHHRASSGDHAESRPHRRAGSWPHHRRSARTRSCWRTTSCMRGWRRCSSQTCR